MRYTYSDDVTNALVELGGEAKLEDIIRVVLLHRSQRGATTIYLKEYVWNTLQKNSAGKGRDIFDPIGKDEAGAVIWRLRNYQKI